MKRILPLLSVFTVFAILSCKDDTKDVPIPDPQPQMGVFLPEKSINYIIYPDVASEIWVWEDSLLIALADDNMCGGYTEKAWFGYNKNRLISFSSTLNEIPYEVSYSYIDNRLDHVSAYSLGMDILEAGFSYSDKCHVQSATLNINSDLLGLISNLFGFRIQHLNTYLQKKATKMSFSDPVLTMQMQWDNNNVSQTILSGDIEATTNLAEIQTMVDLKPLLGAYADLLDFLADTTPIPMTITLHDTIDYTHDNHTNPISGLLYTLDVSVLNTNNVITSSQHGIASITLYFSTPFGTIPFTFPYNLPQQTDKYTYEYDSDGYPTEVFLNGELIKTYIYN